jgi:hypothetical protein
LSEIERVPAGTRCTQLRRSSSKRTRTEEDLVKKLRDIILRVTLGVSAAAAGPAEAQLVDQNFTPNAAREGIVKGLNEQIGNGRGNPDTPNTSLYIINRDPFRAVRRGRQIFQRKFTRQQGQGPMVSDGRGDIVANPALGAGLGDSCATCHGRPRGSAGFGGDVVIKPDSRDAPHLFGLGLKEMLGDEMTSDLRNLRAQAIAAARTTRINQTRTLTTKGVNFGSITARPDGTVDTSQVRGINPDLRVRPFRSTGETISMREFIVGAFAGEMGLQSDDPDLRAAALLRQRVVTPAGMVLDGAVDAIEAPPIDPGEDADGDGIGTEIPVSLVDFMEVYFLNYFKPALGPQNATTARGQSLMASIGCTSCHIPNFTINRDRRHADVETVFDPARGNPFNRLFGTATAFFTEVADGTGLPTLKRPNLGSFQVRNIYTDFKRHDLGPNFWELNYDGTLHKEFLSAPLWGVGTTPPYGHDGRSATLDDVIRRHGGEAQAARNNYVALPESDQFAVQEFLRSLILFAPDDTASNLQPANPAAANFPQIGHGAFALTVLFNNPNELE